MNFFDLNPQVILQAVESLGFNCSGHIQQLNSMENRVFDLRLENGEHLVVKFYRPERWSAESIRDEHAFLFHLKDSEVPVCAPIEQDGESLFFAEELMFAVWPRTGGRLIDEFTNPILERIGGYIARIHSAAADLNLVNRPSMDRDYMIGRHRTYLAEQDLLPPQHIQRYGQICDYLDASMENMMKHCRYQLIHGDCHTGNMLLGDEGLFFLDFDDSMKGPVLQDLWMVVSDSPDEQNRKTDAFLKGYSRFSDFPVENLKYRELMRALRYSAYNGWIARRRHDPAIQKAFPDFGSRDYWDEFINDFTEQIERIESDSGYQAGGYNSPVADQDDEEQLSDEDYFFDLDDGRWTPGQQD